MTIDPEHDRNITGFWAEESIDWSYILVENDISWIIISEYSIVELSDSWQEFSTERDYVVYHLS